MRVRGLFLVLRVALSRRPDVFDQSPGAPTSTDCPSTSTATPSPAGATLGDGTGLPEGCGGQAAPSETVGFVAEGRAWALDPLTGAPRVPVRGRATRDLRVRPAGRPTLLADMQVQGAVGEGADLAAEGADPGGVRLGSPARARDRLRQRSGHPTKRFMDDGKVERLSTLAHRDVRGRSRITRAGWRSVSSSTRDAPGDWLSTTRARTPCGSSSRSRTRCSPRSPSVPTARRSGGSPSTPAP